MNVFVVRYGADSMGGAPAPDFVVCKRFVDAYQTISAQGRDIDSITEIVKLNKSEDDVLLADSIVGQGRFKEDDK